MAEINNKKDYEITADSFKLVQSKQKIHDVAFKTKPTTFFKDALKRFSKNKSSVAGAIILGLLILLTIFVPILSSKNITTVSKKEQFLAPKLFKAGTGFWDGTRKYKGIAIDPDTGMPVGFYAPAVLKDSLKIDKEPTLVNQAQSYGRGGYVLFNTPAGTTDAELYSDETKFTSIGNYQVTINLYDRDNVDGFVQSEYKIVFRYKVGDDYKDIVLKDFSKDYSTLTFNLSNVLSQNNLDEVDGSIVFILKGDSLNPSYILIKDCIFTANEDVENYEDLTKNISFADATQMVIKKRDEVTQQFPVGYWRSTGNKNIFESVIYKCNFVFDTYANVYDEAEVEYAKSELDKLVNEGYCSYSISDPVGTFKVLNDKCPITSILSVKTSTITGKILSVQCMAYRYLSYGYKSMPKFIFGTDDKGQDLWKKAFTSLRTSLILGLCTAAFCFAFGLIWGSISGYFGGNVDLFMERFCEILSGVPWIVIMTLCILHLGNGFGTFFLALCMTGWMGTAARTRTQFYRFKGREYVLASRTLGSSDMRLIFKHILPNSMGTIITSSVLMIPSVIFNEATLAYLNLGLQGLQSFGVMMSDNQTYLQSYPNLVIFPAVIIALMMISFNLFGNGLRDAFNPSLKGSE